MDALVEHGELLGAIAGKLRIDTHNSAPVLVKTEILVLQVAQCGGEQPGGG